MIDLEKLKTKIDESGMTMVAISQKSGISREVLYNKLKGESDFTVSQAVGLATALGLSQTEIKTIFFAKNVN